MKTVPRLYGNISESTPGSWWRRTAQSVRIKCSAQHVREVPKLLVDVHGVVRRYRCDAGKCEYSADLRLEGWNRK